MEEEDGLVEAVHVVGQQVHHLPHGTLSQGTLAQSQGLESKKRTTFDLYDFGQEIVS